MNTEQETIEKDIEKYAAIDSFAASEGGKELLKTLAKDITNTVSALMTGHKNMAHTELIGNISDMKAKFDLYLVLTRAGKNKEMAREYLKDILTKEDELNN